MNDLYKAIDALNNIVNEEPPRGRQDGPGLPKPSVPKINPAVPAAGPVRANQINPQAMAATKAAASVVNAPKPAPTMAMPKPKPAAPAPRAKVKATAANTKDYDKTVALQKKLGVTADGIMGPQTRAAMAAAAAAKKPATPASQVTPTAGDPGTQQAASPAPTGTPRKVSTVAPGTAPAQDVQAARVAKSNAALAGDVEKAKKAGSGILDKITGGISDLFKPSNRRAERDAENKASAQAYRASRNRTATAAAPAAADRIASLPNATTTDRAGNISPDGRARQPSDAAPTTRTVRQRVTDPGEKAALVAKVNRAREMQRLALAAGSTDPDDIRAYVNRMNKTQGTGAAGGTAPNTY